MVADSITDSQLFHGSPISRDFVKKRKANWFWKLKQWKMDARRKQWIYQWKRGNLSGQENGSRREKFSYLEAYRIAHKERSYKDDLEETSSASSPTSVLKNKDDSVSNKSGDCFCCSKQMKEGEEEDFDDALDNWDGFSDALNSFDNEDKKKGGSALPEKANQKSRRKKKKSDHHQQQQQDCPICSEEMDATDLSFVSCPCGFKLCLFCHKQVNENDGRCPACRKKYVAQTSSDNSGEVSFQQRGRGTIRLSPSFRGLDRA